MDLEKIQRRIARALAIARGGANKFESESALKRAQEIAAKYDIDLASFEAKTAKEESAKGDAIRVDYTPKSSALWRASLGWAITAYAGISMVRSGKNFALIGRQVDIDLWRTLYERAETEIDTEAAKYIASRPHLSSGEKKSMSDTFRKGAASGFYERLERYKAQAANSEQGKANAAVMATTSTGPTTALVMVGRELSVKAAEKRHFPKLSNMVVTVAAQSRSGYYDGHKFGKGLGVQRGNLS